MVGGINAHASFNTDLGNGAATGEHSGDFGGGAANRRNRESKSVDARDLQDFFD